MNLCLLKPIKDLFLAKLHRSVLRDTTGPGQTLQLCVLSDDGVCCNEENLMAVVYG